MTTPPAAGTQQRSDGAAVVPRRGRRRASPSGRPGRRGLLRRIGGLRHTSPGRLQLLLAALLALGLLTGLTAGLTGAATAAGTTDLGGRAQPLLAEAETILSSLADADTTAAQAFLAGGLEPAELTERYEQDLARVTTTLSSAARRTPEGSKSGMAVRDLAAGVTRYAALVATARANNRQGLPVGSSYLAAASHQSRDELQPAARQLFGLAQAEVGDGFGAARGTVGVVALGLLLAALLVVLIAGQRYLSRTTRRTFNVPLVAATGLTVLLAVGVAGILIAQNSHLRTAEDKGAVPANALAEARLLALQMRADEALTLAARGSDASYGSSSGGAATSYEDDYKQASARLGTLLRDDLYAGIDSDLRRELNQAAESYLSYDAQHTEVRRLDDEANDYAGAVKLAVGPATTDAFEGVRSALDTAMNGRKAVFAEQIDAAGAGLGPLAVLGPLVALAVCALAVAGIRARLEEYR